MPIKFKNARQNPGKRTKARGTQFKVNDEPKPSNASAPAVKPSRRRMRAKSTQVDDRPKLQTRPAARREPPNPSPTPPRTPRKPQKPEIGPVNAVDMLTKGEHFDLICKLENLGHARTVNETALLKKLKRWRKTQTN